MTIGFPYVKTTAERDCRKWDATDTVCQRTGQSGSRSGGQARRHGVWARWRPFTEVGGSGHGRHPVVRGGDAPLDLGIRTGGRRQTLTTLNDAPRRTTTITTTTTHNNNSNGGSSDRRIDSTTTTNDDDNVADRNDSRTI